jgi:hypothetical protein
MYRILFFIILILIFKNISAQQISWDNYKNDTLIAIGTYILADEKIYMSRDTMLTNRELLTNIDSLKVISFTMTAFSLGKEFEGKSDSSLLTSSMINAIRERNINYKFVNLKEIKLKNLSGEIYVPSIEKIKIIFTD